MERELAAYELRADVPMTIEITEQESLHLTSVAFADPAQTWMGRAVLKLVPAVAPTPPPRGSARPGASLTLVVLDIGRNPSCSLDVLLRRGDVLRAEFLVQLNGRQPVLHALGSVVSRRPPPPAPAPAPAPAAASKATATTKGDDLLDSDEEEAFEEARAAAAGGGDGGKMSD